MSLVSLLLFLLATTGLAEEPSTAGFITIDCGLDDVSGYRDEDTGLVYARDEPYTSTGVNWKISDSTRLQKYKTTIRSFPDGKRNCYSLGPVQSGSKYRIKAEFANDQVHQPTFELHLGVNLYETVWIGDEIMEIITVADSETIQLCLVNIGDGPPYITELEMRPLPFSMYPMLTNSSYAIVFDKRINYGGKKKIGFPYDIYDRGWYPKSDGKNISTTKKINLWNDSRYLVPEAILQTASEAESLSDRIAISGINTNYQDSIHRYVCLYFAELVELGSNETREFNIYAGDEHVYGPFKPRFLQQDVYITPEPGRREETHYIRATENSTLPPIVNAVEIFKLLKMPLLPTKESNVRALLETKKQLGVSEHWEGDPCVPPELKWKGLACDYDASGYSIVISLNLSRGGLRGRIPYSIANLTSLRSLDLSFNYFAGEIPEYIGDLSDLKSLYLEGNNLSGAIPIAISEKSKNGSLVLSIGNNPYLCISEDCKDHHKQRKKKNILPILISCSVATIFFLAFIISVCLLKRKKKPTTRRVFDLGQMSNEQHGEATLHPGSNQFSETDIKDITNNFTQPIGKGGSGTVYLGKLNNGREVAVKVLIRTGYGAMQFKVEAELLTRLHHRYLLSLLGYCKETFALLYEFMPLGSLAEHLSGDLAYRNNLNWSLRLKIALQSAEGLEYMHNGCKPPIIHRDVKSSNILLAENFDAKLADFGLSRAFAYEGSTYFSTLLAGTPGYLDPEYQQTNMLSTKSDVYSFGIVLLELITGKPPIIKGLTVTHITRDVRNKMETGDIHCIFDPRMQGNYEVSSIRRVMEIALSCTALKSVERPTMSTVVAELRDCLGIESSRLIKSA